VVSIIVTHDFVDALVLGDTIGVMEQGRLLQIGSREELLRHPKSRFVADFTGVNFFQGQVVHCNGEGLCRIRIGDATLCALACEAERVSLTFFPRDVTLHRNPPEGSAQNVFCGSVREIIHLGDRVRVALEAGLPVVAEISDLALQELGIQEGDRVYAALKATAIKTYG